MRRKPLVILLLVMLCLTFIITIAGCGNIKKIIQSSGPSGPGQHIDIGYGWDQGLGPGWQSRRSDLCIIGGNIYGVSPGEIDPYIIQLGSDTIHYRYNLSPSEKQMSGLAAFATDFMGLSELEVMSTRGYEGNYEEGSRLGSSIDKSDYERGYILFEFQVPFSSTGLYVFEGMEDNFLILRQ